MLLYEFPSTIKSHTPFTLTIENSKDQLVFNIGKHTVNKNILSFSNNNILFTTPEKEQLLFNELKPIEIEYLISKLNQIISGLPLPETISIFHYDQIFNNNLFKLYNNPTKITHIISSNANIISTRDKNDIIINNPNINIDIMNQSLYASIIKNEINHSLVFLKINNLPLASLRDVSFMPHTLLKSVKTSSASATR